jgi:hypothetical protein
MDIVYAVMLMPRRLRLGAVLLVTRTNFSGK